MRTLAYTLGALLASCAVNAADLPEEKIVWAKEYPKSIDAKESEPKGVVVLFGTYEEIPGWKMTEANFQYVPVAGGNLSKPTKLEFTGGKWGKYDPNDKAKIVPIQIPMNKGKWNLRVVFILEGKDRAGNAIQKEYNAPFKRIEVK